jgi:hypothetical protein
VAQQRSTFAKLQREREKKEKALAKADRRAQQAAAAPEEDTPTAKPDPDNEANILAALAELHAAYEDGSVSMDEFEDRRDQLRQRLQIG